MLGAAAITLLAFREGGFDPSSWRGATVALLAAAGIAIVLRRGVAASRAQAAVVLALGAPLSAFWRIDVAPLGVTELRAHDGRWTVGRVNASLDRAAA